MLRHAFEHWGCSRVELKTDALNKQSRAALLRTGQRGGHAPQAHDDMERPREGLRVLQYLGHRMAGNKVETDEAMPALRASS